MDLVTHNHLMERQNVSGTWAEHEQGMPSIPNTFAGGGGESWLIASVLQICPCFQHTESLQESSLRT